MPRRAPDNFQALLAGLVLPLLSILLLPISLIAVAACLAHDAIRKRVGGVMGSRAEGKAQKREKKGCVIISGGRMTKGLM